MRFDFSSMEAHENDIFPRTECLPLRQTCSQRTQPGSGRLCVAHWKIDCFQLSSPPVPMPFTPTDSLVLRSTSLPRIEEVLRAGKGGGESKCPGGAVQLVNTFYVL